MEVRLIDSWQSSGGSDLNLLRPVLTVPGGHTVTVLRKFIVLVPRNGAYNGSHCVVVIGPVYGDYLHEAILDECMAEENGLRISGGGMFEVTLRSFDGKAQWSSRFFGKSGDYGNFDPNILSWGTHQAIADAIGMPVTFEWIGYAQNGKR